MTPDKTLVLGDQLPTNIEQRDGSVTDVALTAYVQALADKLAVSGFTRPLQVRLTRASRDYAILLPNRVLYLSSGLMLRAETESELAAILAHAQAHTTSLHILNATQPESLVVLLGDCVLSQLMPPLTPASKLGQAEIQANVVAVRLLRLVHYDPMSLFVILSKLVYEHVGWDKAILPKDLNVARGAVESDLVPFDGYVLDTSQFAAVHQKLERLADSTRPTAGATLMRRRP